jgi:ketosteroid isomerase-like protein
VAVLVLGSVVATQKLGARGTEIEMVQNDSIPEMTEAISARLITQWDAWKNRDAASNNAIIAHDFHAFSVDGLLRTGKPTEQQMAEQPITGYKLSEFHVVPVGADAALVTYFANVKTPGKIAEFQKAVGEVWEKRNGQWVIRAFSGTMMR